MTHNYDEYIERFSVDHQVVEPSILKPYSTHQIAGYYDASRKDGRIRSELDRCIFDGVPHFRILEFVMPRNPLVRIDRLRLLIEEFFPSFDLFYIQRLDLYIFEDSTRELVLCFSN
jgi:hypothetical protein